MSQALYRAYRPQKFEDVIGQDVAVRTLRNAIEQGRVAHAYLFTGTKGTGKTTLAKLLAKAMNCVNGPTTDPCGVCEECVAIAEGRAIDVVEIDAASNTGIDDVREKIIKSVAFQPSKGTRRVYIIDEAHQLSKSAFNALLKTIEEPPPHVLFVFCTTETHMMMATVRDRCQRISMRSPSSDSLVEVLAKVCEKENIQVDTPVLRAVARAANGSFRNALGTLEMLTTTFGNTFTREDVQQHLGVVAEEVLFSMSDAIISENAGEALQLIEQLTQQGIDIDQFARSLTEHLRGILLYLHGVHEAVSVGDTERMKEQSSRADERRILSAIDCIADATTRIRVGSDARISLETAIVRACQGLGLPLLSLRLAALEQKIQGGYGLPLQQQQQPVQEKKATPDSAPAPEPTPQQPAAKKVATVMSQADLANIQEWWLQVQRIVGKNVPMRAALQALTPQSCDTKTIVLAAKPGALVTSKLQDSLQSAVAEVTGHQLHIEIVEVAETQAVVEPQVEPAIVEPKQEPKQEKVSPSAGEDAGVANLMSMFDATPVAATSTDNDEQ